MNRKRYSVKWLATVLVLLMCTFILSGAVSVTNADLNRKGSIQLTLKAEESIAEANIELYMIGTAGIENKAIVFTLNAQYKDKVTDYSELSEAEKAEQLSKHIEDSEPTKSAVTDTSGSVNFADLNTGLYLVVQNGFTGESEYDEIKPFLVSIPTQTGNQLAYDIKAKPKAAKTVTTPPTSSSTTEPTSSTTSTTSTTKTTKTTKTTTTKTTTTTTTTTTKAPDKTKSSVDKKDTKLPQTGLLMWPLLVSGIAGVLLLVVGGLLFLSVRKGNRRSISLGIVFSAALGLILIAGSGVTYIDELRSERQSEQFSIELMDSLQDSMRDRQGSSPAVSIASSVSDSSISELTEQQEQTEPEDVQDNDSGESINEAEQASYMPSVDIGGESLMGSIELPTLDIVLPVIYDWSYSGLKKAPCRYSGSVYTDNLVIMAHNYKRHFGRLKNLEIGDPVQFVDVEGYIYSYAVAKRETLAPGDVDKMVDSGYDLTLFTCTRGGASRFAVRLDRVY